MNAIEMGNAERGAGSTRQFEMQSLQQERLALGLALIAEFEIDRLKCKREEVLRNDASRRYEIIDRGGMQRPFSELDVRDRANAAADRALVYIQEKIGDKARRGMHAEYVAKEMDRDAKVLQQLKTSRMIEVKSIEEQLDRTIADSQTILDQGVSIKSRYEDSGQPVPAPLLTGAEIADLQESMIARGDIGKIRMMEAIRERLSPENALPVRTDQEIGRLRAQLFLAESRLDLERESLTRFEETKHVRHWESGSDPSLAELDQQIDWLSDELELTDSESLDWDNERKQRIKERVEKISIQHEILLDGIESERDRISENISWKAEVVTTLIEIVTKEGQRYRNEGRELPPPLFTDEELEELDSHAARRRDPVFYRSLVAIERDCDRRTGSNRDRADRAKARAIIAEIYLQEADAALAKFNQCRDRIPVITKDDGARKIRVVRLDDFAPHSPLEQALFGILKLTPQYREVAAAVDALGNRLTAECDEANELVAYLKDVAREYAEEFERLHPGESLPKPRFTTSEINRLEQQAIRETDLAQRAKYSAYLCDAWGFDHDKR